MKNIGVVSYNINCNFTNYGSALQSWALCRAIDILGESMGFQSILVDYFPKELEGCDILNPVKRMWDADEVSKKMVELSMDAIRKNYQKFESFYSNRFHRSKLKYYDYNFEDVDSNENINGYVCGSDTIWFIEEYNGAVDGYFANFDCMKQKSIAYAASFGDSHFGEDICKILNDRFQNFLAIGLRENLMLDYVKDHVDVPVQQVVDPTLLLHPEDYDAIAAKRIVPEKYLFLYTRRYTKEVEDFAEKIAKEQGLKIVEISLRAANAEKGHLMMYEAGVEEFLSLIKYAECVVTNSYHCIIMSLMFQKLFYTFYRLKCVNKIRELTEWLGLSERILVTGNEDCADAINYKDVYRRIAEARETSLDFLTNALKTLC